jgi:hypothetical protein
MRRRRTAAIFKVDLNVIDERISSEHMEGVRSKE